VELLVESGGQSWLSQSRDVYDETKSRFCFNDLPGYKIANQIITYNKKRTQYNSSNILSVFQQVWTRRCMCGELHSWHGISSSLWNITIHCFWSLAVSKEPKFKSNGFHTLTRFGVSNVDI